MKCVVFICRKCGHNLYVEERPEFLKKLGKIAITECPNCVEEGYENRILSHVAVEFPGDSA